MSSESAVFTLSASAKSCAPSALMPSWLTLQARAGQKCQRLLTLCLIRKVEVGGGVLDARQRAVDLERLGEALRALGSDPVESEAAGKGNTNTKVSAAADTCLIRQVSWMTHLSDVNVLLILRASLSLMMPSAV